MKTIALVLCLAAAAAADEVVLKSGGRISGVAEERGDQVFVRTEHGQVVLPKHAVARIDRTKSSTIQEYDRRRAGTDLSSVADVEGLLRWTESRGMRDEARALKGRLHELLWRALDRDDAAALEGFAARVKAEGNDARAAEALTLAFDLRRKRVDGKDAAALYALGLWAKSHGFAADALVLFQKTILADPDHEFARRELGFRRQEGRWVTEREFREGQGLVEFEGDWMTPEAKEAVITSRTLEKERRLLEAERKQLALERADIDRRRAEAEARIREAEARIRELESRPPRVIAPPAPACGVAGCGFGMVQHYHGTCGLGGCRLATVHTHCSRPGCRVTVRHVHCPRTGCSRLDLHRH